MRCPTCHGSGHVSDPNEPCEAKIAIGHETFECFADRPHPGAPHMTLACEPCPECGGMDEHTESCVSCLLANSLDGMTLGWGWLDGAEGLALLDDYWWSWRDAYLEKQKKS